MTTSASVRLEAFQRAFDRAGQAAVYGSSKTKAGMFDFAAADLKQKARSLVHEARSAHQSFAQWECLRKVFWTSPDVEGLLQSHAWMPLKSTSAALARDALLRAFRLTDQVQTKDEPESISLLYFGKMLRDPVVARRLLSDEWWFDQGLDSTAATEFRLGEADRVQRFVSLIPADWREVDSITDTTFRDLRERLLPMRKYLAHPNQYRAELDIAHNDAATLVHSTLALATLVGHLVLAHQRPQDVETVIEGDRIQAIWFWRHVANQLASATMPNELHEPGELYEHG